MKIISFAASVLIGVAALVNSSPRSRHRPTASGLQARPRWQRRDQIGWVRYARRFDAKLGR